MSTISAAPAVASEVTNLREQLACFNKIIAEAGQKHLELFKVDLVNGDWPFEEAQFSGALNVHFYESKLITNIAYSLASDGLLYIETIANRKGNFVGLPKAGEIRIFLQLLLSFYT
jgi:hypothetical protein